MFAPSATDVTPSVFLRLSVAASLVDAMSIVSKPDTLYNSPFAAAVPWSIVPATESLSVSAPAPPEIVSALLNVAAASMLSAPEPPVTTCAALAPRVK